MNVQVPSPSYIYNLDTLKELQLFQGMQKGSIAGLTGVNF